MIISCRNRKLDFTIDAPPSKSIYHRELIIRFLGGDYTHLAPLDSDNDDVRATKSVLTALHDCITDRTEDGSVILPCNESGSTLRFMIPVAAAFVLGQNRDSHGVDKLIFTTAGRLFDRPLNELRDAMSPHGITIEKDDVTRTIIVTGEMTPGTYIIDGSVSSQYISGLLMALTLFTEDSHVEVTGELKSVHYIELTTDALLKYGYPVRVEGSAFYPTCCGYNTASSDSTSQITGAASSDLSDIPFKVEGDWSNGAFLLCMKEVSDITVNNLNPASRQGDRAILDYLDALHKASEDSNIPGPDASLIWDCTDIPDITPYMAVIAAFTLDTAVFTGISRLRIKESDRVMAVREQLSEIGVKTEETDDTLTVYRYCSSGNAGNIIDSLSAQNTEPIKLSSYNDHRMAMCAILIAVILKTDIELDNIDCLRKSFPELIDIVRKYMLP
ncbi:MAG: hypothetical protein IJ065_11185 [Eubacterium sp.]|nr:hypothetical protein [Eubacterium sp.]